MTAGAEVDALLPAWPAEVGDRPSRPGGGDHGPGPAYADADPVERMRAALSDVAAGRPVVLVDDQGRGDLVVAGDVVDAHLMSFLVRHTSGFVCVALPERDADRLDLPLMEPGHRASPATATQCVAVDARVGVGTGISAADRACTARLLAAPGTVAADLVRPGHVVPLRVPADGVLASRGRAEAAVDLASIAGLNPAAALSRLLDPTGSGELATGAELELFAREHGLRLVGVADVVAYRRRFETLVDRGAAALLPLPAGRFTAVGYRGRLDGREHVALVHGEVGTGQDVLVHVHRECPDGDLLAIGSHCSCGARLRSALERIAAAGRGVVVYLRTGRGLPDVLGSSAPEPDDALADVGEQILRDLGVRSSRPLDLAVLDHQLPCRAEQRG